MRAFLQGLAGLIYLCATGAIGLGVALAYRSGARSVPELELAAARQLGQASLSLDLVFYVIVVAVWVILSWPAFLMLGAWGTNAVNRRMAARMDEMSLMMREQSRTHQETLTVLKDLRDAQKTP